MRAGTDVGSTAVKVGDSIEHAATRTGGDSAVFTRCGRRLDVLATGLARHRHRRATRTGSAPSGASSVPSSPGSNGSCFGGWTPFGWSAMRLVMCWMLVWVRRRCTWWRAAHPCMRSFDWHGQLVGPARRGDLRDRQHRHAVRAGASRDAPPSLTATGRQLPTLWDAHRPVLSSLCAQTNKHNGSGESACRRR